MGKRSYRKAWENESPQALWGPCHSDLWPATAEHNSPTDFRKGIKPLPGDPSRQNAGGFAPEFDAYWDETRRCSHCGASYLFAASEQKFWYEELKFYTYSEPTGCPDCRRKLRHYRRTNRKVAERLQSIDRTDWRALRELGHLYLQLGSKRGALETFRRAKNLCSDQAGLEALLNDIACSNALLPLHLPRGQFRRLGWIDSKTCPDDLKSRIAEVEPVLSQEGREILAEVVRRWTQARYGDS